MPKTGCKHCTGDVAYNDRYDTLYCSSCDVWLEPECTCPPNCEFKGRPDKPSEIVITQP